MKIYLAGSLFKEADITQRKYEAEKLREKGFQVYNPITDAVFNTDKNSTPQPIDIFQGDFKEIEDCDIFLCCLDDAIAGDSGLCAEIGIVVGLNATREKKIKIVAVLSDIRLSTANKYDIPSLGMNHFLLGCLENENTKICESFEEVLLCL